ncbi:mitochondrial import receptor subunit TOM22 homolog [Panthera pardus]|uniref:Mitochondrial import receptor subunit TOM22 homolog n=1 Tax=Panthera pardus TaxID=9691 RepID=A0A9W2VN78_PANPR|nr:mitochondrial import receptor subunit TOM22 homolog [Panthera pardus]
MPRRHEELEEEGKEELDETLSERLWGLTEMVPERVRSMAGAPFHHSLFGAQKMCRFSRPAFMILVLPVVFEIEKLRMEQQQHPQRRQILVGPNAGSQGACQGSTFISWKALYCSCYVASLAGQV